MKAAWGKHLLFDAYGVDKSKLQDRQAIRRLLADLPKKFRMRILGKPAVLKISSDNKKYKEWGLSGFAVLLESHISVHTWPSEGYVAMDVYSCKNFREKEVVEHLKYFWEAKKYVIKVVIRG